MSFISIFLDYNPDLERISKHFKRIQNILAVSFKSMLNLERLARFQQSQKQQKTPPILRILSGEV